MERVPREVRVRQVAQCEASGMTMRDWCEANDVPESTLRWWRRRLRAESEAPLAPAFLEVAADGGLPAATGGAPIVARVGGVELLLAGGFDERDAAAAMRAAASL